MPEADKCRECDFSHPAHEGKPWCKLANDFKENLGGFCPKELDIEEIKKNCKYCLLSEKGTGGDDMCRASSHEHGHYCHCWIKTLEDLCSDPDFKLRKSAQ